MTGSVKVTWIVASRGALRPLPRVGAQHVRSELDDGSRPARIRRRRREEVIHVVVGIEASVVLTEERGRIAAGRRRRRSFAAVGAAIADEVLDARVEDRTAAHQPGKAVDERNLSACRRHVDQTADVRRRQARAVVAPPDARAIR